MIPSCEGIFIEAKDLISLLRKQLCCHGGTEAQKNTRQTSLSATLSFCEAQKHEIKVCILCASVPLWQYVFAFGEKSAILS
jgi:hypothetical protein